MCGRSTASKRCLTKAPCAISFGPTPTTAWAGASRRAALAIPLVKTSRSSSTTRTGSRSLHEPISSSWRATTGATSARSSPSFRRPTIATDAATWLQSWKSTSISATTSCSSTPHHDEASRM
eukprot:Amastigsp_a841581_1497.p4 type:complete len:122 gc:universal Amastigsp_a841581_1497:560-925(+)